VKLPTRSLLSVETDPAVLLDRLASYEPSPIISKWA
jgi:hypothetical protein